MLRIHLGLFLFCCAGISSLPAASIGLSGTFLNDNDIATFHFHVDNTGPVTISTTSYAGGGFASIFTLFGSDGLFQFSSTNYGSPSENLLAWTASVGGEDYILTLTQYDNAAIGPNLSDGFVHDADLNYTAELPLSNSGTVGSFWLLGEQRTGDWAVQFSSPDPSLTASVPEPSTGILCLSAAVLMAAGVRRRNPSVHLNSNRP